MKEMLVHAYVNFFLHFTYSGALKVCSVTDFFIYIIQINQIKIAGYPAGYYCYPAGYRIVKKSPDMPDNRIVTGYPAHP